MDRHDEYSKCIYKLHVLFNSIHNAHKLSHGGILGCSERQIQPDVNKYTHMRQVWVCVRMGVRADRPTHPTNMGELCTSIGFGLLADADVNSSILQMCMKVAWEYINHRLNRCELNLDAYVWYERVFEHVRA